jgi:hypothetical protein
MGGYPNHGICDCKPADSFLKDNLLECSYDGSIDGLYRCQPLLYLDLEGVLAWFGYSIA